MTQANAEIVREQGQGEGAETQTDASVSAPGQGEEVARQAAAAAAQEEADKERAEKECEGLRKAAVKAFRGAEGAYRKGLLETGRLCHEYLVHRMSPPI